MASPSKKINTKSSSQKKKTTAKKTTVKRKRRKKSTNISNFKKNIFVVLAVFLMIFLVTFGYFLGQSSTPNEQVKRVKIKSQESYTTQQLLDDLSKIKTRKSEENKNIEEAKKLEVAKEIKKAKKVEKVEKLKKAEIIEKSSQVKKVQIEKEIPQVPLYIERGDEKKVEKSIEEIKSVKIEKRKNIALAYRGEKPKLAIIIDDVSSAKQLKYIRSLPVKVTPSIFPPYERSKSNHKLAEGLKHYMVHLPMQSGKAFDKQYGTLKISDSKEKMQARVKEIRRLFPTARYINNHTGSVFTEDYKAMKILYSLLRKEGFVFVDSRTIGTTKVGKIAHDYGDAYVGRDIFIDNKHNVPYIHKQLRQAVKIAKKKGYAVAIGHPHKMTMKALESAKDIFKDVELVYIDEIYKKRNK